MKPIIKYQGGKTKELPIITQIAPPKFTRVIEPFAGGAAVALHYGETTVLNDISPLPINLYLVVGSPEYPQLQARVNAIMINYRRYIISHVISSTTRMVRVPMS